VIQRYVQEETQRDALKRQEGNKEKLNNEDERREEKEHLYSNTNHTPTKRQLSYTKRNLQPKPGTRCSTPPSTANEGKRKVRTHEPSSKVPTSLSKKKTESVGTNYEPDEVGGHHGEDVECPA